VWISVRRGRFELSDGVVLLSITTVVYEVLLSVSTGKKRERVSSIINSRSLIAAAGLSSMSFCLLLPAPAVLSPGFALLLRLPWN